MMNRTPNIHSDKVFWEIVWQQEEVNINTDYYWFNINLRNKVKIYLWDTE